MYRAIYNVLNSFLRGKRITYFSICSSELIVFNTGTLRKHF
ncbi:Uncharacterised protein [Vibrio cholerae]|nr:Uncharacterised protein [Vibrio cholerae]